MRTLDIRKKTLPYSQIAFLLGCIALGVATHVLLSAFRDPQPAAPIADAAPLPGAFAPAPLPPDALPPAKADKPAPVPVVMPGFIAPNKDMQVQVEREMAEMTRGLQGALKAQREKVMAHLAEVQAKKVGPVAKSRLGLSLSAPNKLVSDQLRLPPGHGLIVSGVTKGSPADTAGLKTNDVLFEMDGAMVRSDAGKFRQTIEGKAPGTLAKLTVIRAGADMKLDLRLP